MLCTYVTGVHFLLDGANMYYVGLKKKRDNYKKIIISDLVACIKKTLKTLENIQMFVNLLLWTPLFQRLCWVRCYEQKTKEMFVFRSEFFPINYFQPPLSIKFTEQISAQKTPENFKIAKCQAIL